ncbi:hypothetical protein INT44_007681 [Umbelopsis vinacea]|uniref:Conserved oligomeric Golgi complex subunit 1 n=1 Tax=Umbelopsis vinacea TaxID=44442 RepID=A0A8H7UCU0_9FUNG|nr:hypothetical protein INT44_007681 [Umbelopsis vinacea]
MQRRNRGKETGVAHHGWVGTHKIYSPFTSLQMLNETTYFFFPPCSEQYRDLISAADAIVSMKKAAHAVQSKFDLMQVACDVDTIHQKTTKIAPGNDSGEDNEKKRYLYVSAAQMKLLVDVPEQIWHALENDLYLEASRLFLLAKMVYKNLQTEEDVPFVVIVSTIWKRCCLGELLLRSNLVFAPKNTFPVVQKQWDAISQFRLHIIQRAENHLKSTSCSAQVKIPPLNMRS